MLKTMRAQAIKDWVTSQQYMLDAPEVYVPEMNSVVRDWDEHKDDIKFCFLSLVEYSAFIANLGVAILYEELNFNKKGVVCERSYYPEPKLRRRMVKEGIPHFSKETFHPIKDFDVLGFSSYYPLQFFGVPDVLTMGGIPIHSTDRTEEDPIICMGGVAAFNPSPVHKFIDCFLLGDGEGQLHDALMLIKEMKKAKASRHDILFALQTKIRGAYVPQFYEERYFPVDHATHPNQVEGHYPLIDGVPAKIKKSIAEISQIYPLTKMFMSNSEGSEMSAQSLEITRGKISGNSRIFTGNDVVKASSFSSKNILGLKGSKITQLEAEGVHIFKKDSEKLLKIKTKIGNEIVLSKDHPILLNGEWKPALLANKKDLVCMARKTINYNPDYNISDDEIFIIGAFIADGTLATSENKFSIQKKDELFIDMLEEPLRRLGILFYRGFSDGKYTLSTKCMEKDFSNSLSSSERHEQFLKSNEYKIFDKWGLVGKKAEGKIFPDFVFKFSERQQKLLLNALASYDGSICLSKGSRGIDLGSKSREQCLIIKDLLLNFGIISKVPDFKNGGSYQVQIREFVENNLLVACSVFDCWRGQEYKINELQNLCFSCKENVFDVIPFKFWEKIRVLKSTLYNNVGWGRLSESIIGYNPNGDPALKRSKTRVSRKLFKKFFYSKEFNKYLINDLEVIQAISDDIYWNEIVSIEEVESEDCVDIGVECPTHNYIANGFLVHNCGQKCQFCEGSFRSQPYRERPFEMIKDAFPKLIRNVGGTSLTPYGFNLSDHHKINDILYFLLEDEDKKISMSSQHIDHFNEHFARIAFESGNRSLTLAIEAATQRMRDKVGKNLTEEKILEAFDIVFRIGFSKVKIYMIANLPEETQEDIDYLVVLAKKIWDIQNKIQGDHHKTQIRFSFTPYNGKAHTPLQWAKVGELDEEGLPLMKKTLTTALEGLRELGYGFRVGTDSELSVVNQCMSFGDRRMADVIEDTFNDKDFNYRGGMSIGFKKPMAAFQEKLKGRGLSYYDIFREKDKDQVFSWDFINMGITKKFLQRAYFDNFKNEINLTRCQESCEKCGGCTPISNKLFKDYWNGKLEKGRTDILEMLQKRFKKQTVLKLRFKIYVHPEFRYVHASKIKNYIRRAFIRIDAPVRNKITLASDKLKFNDWTYGYDYGEILVWTKEIDMNNILERLNETFDDTKILEFVSVDKYTDTAGSFTSAYDNILYSFKVPKEDYSFFTIDKALKEVLSSEEYIIKMKVLGEKRDTTKVIDMDVRDQVVDLWVVDKNDYSEVYALLKENVGVYELFPKVFSTSKRNILKYEVFREVYTLPSVAEDAFDMFSIVCSSCGRNVEQDVLGEDVHEELCVRCKHGYKLEEG